MILELLKWYQKNQRVLPWRTNPSPYAIWVSEIMCQQTRIDTVIPYYLRFMNALPTIYDLANAKEEVLLKLWQGLGYYNRVRNMQLAAKEIVDEYQGVFPKKYEEVLKLKGIGEYTAGAILSMAYHLPYAAIDGNALRVLSRFYANDADISLDQTKKNWKEKVEALKIDDFGMFNQALMDLGAMVCLPNEMPKCDICPLKADCLAHQRNLELEFPFKSGKVQKKEEELTLFLIELDGKILLRKRPSKGLLAGMYEFVHQSGKLSIEDVKELFGSDLIRIQKGPTLSHIFTHKKWKMNSFYIKLSNYVPKEQEGFYSIEEIKEKITIPQAFLQFFDYLN